jgi:hypothetical protein
MPSLISKFGDQQSFQEIFEPGKQMQYTTDERRCYFGTAPTLTQVNLAYGPKAAQSWLVLEIFDFSEYCGAKTKIDNLQLSELSEIIASKYAYLKVSELMLFFRQLKEGKFGKLFYGSFDPMAVTQALHKFIAQRGEAYYNHEHNNDQVYDEYFGIMEKQRSNQHRISVVQQTTVTMTTTRKLTITD